MIQTPVIFVALGIAATGMVYGVYPAAAQASETVYDCRFDPGASPLVWAIIRYDDFTGRISVDASHLEDGDQTVSPLMNMILDEIEFQHEVRNAGRLENITSYRINTVNGRATGSVSLYGDDGNYIRGGPLPVDGYCTITTPQAESASLSAISVSGRVCHEDNGPTQFLDSQRYCASSVLPPQAGNTYGPKNLFWGPDEAAWCEGVAGNGEGETIRLETVPAVTAYAVIIRNGYQKSASTFSNNGRAKIVEIEAAGRVERFALHDASGEQRLEFRNPVRAEAVTVRIVSVYPGTRYSDTCLSGLWLDLEDY